MNRYQAEVAAMGASSKNSLGCIPDIAGEMAVLPNNVRTIEHGI